MKKILLALVILFSAQAAFAVEASYPATRSTDVDAGAAKKIWAAGPTECYTVDVCALSTNAYTIQVGYGSTWAGGTDLYGLPVSGNTCKSFPTVRLGSTTKSPSTQKVWVKSAGNDNQGATISCGGK